MSHFAQRDTSIPYVVYTHDTRTAMELPEPTAEQVRATDELFTKESPETDAMMGLFSFATSLGLLQHLAHEAKDDVMVDEDPMSGTLPEGEPEEDA